jgi:hypothetical protein
MNNLRYLNKKREFFYIKKQPLGKAVFLTNLQPKLNYYILLIVG